MSSKSERLGTGGLICFFVKFKCVTVVAKSVRHMQWSEKYNIFLCNVGGTVLEPIMYTIGKIAGNNLH